MASSNNHFATAYKNSCISRPRHPSTTLPLTIEEAAIDENRHNDSSLKKEERVMHARQLDEELERNRSDWKTDEEQDETLEEEIEDHHSKILQNDLTNLLQDDAKFYKHLQTLRLENKKTLKTLEKFYRTRPKLKATIERPKDFLRKMQDDFEEEKDALFANKVYSSITNSNTEESEENYNGNANYRSISYDKHSVNLSSSESEEDPRKDWPRVHSQNILPDDKDEDFRGRDFSYQVIDSMWDNFSVDNYAPVEKGPKEEPVPVKEWKPSRTIPQPFNMTLREAAKAKTKSKRREKLEKELFEKKMAEEAELRKKFRARPLPASTFIKLYEEQKAGEEKRRQYTRSLNKAILEATQRPFTFMKREEEKKELRHSQSMEEINKKLDTKQGFKATPFPEKLFNLSLDDRVAEQNEYRKIKIKMRSEEMLANSSLPPNMRARGEKYAVNKRYEKSRENTSMRKSKNKSFRPNINHDIPDYEELHRKFETDLIRKRMEKSPTICEPFNLHTAKVPHKRALSTQIRTLESGPSTLKRSLERSRQSAVRRSSPSLRSSMSDEAPPYAMTETARLRQSLNQDILTKKTKAMEEERKKAQRRKRREEKLQEEVIRKSVGNDLKYSLDKQNKEKLKSYRESEIARKQAYREYLKEMKARVKQRPLLFEQESQTNAKRTAERKYRQLLREAGVDEDMLETLVTEDGDITDGESDESDDVLSAEGEADQSGASKPNANDTITLDDSEDDEYDSEQVINDAE